ncbi:Uncharacterized protein dnm_087800 [Desulfonema magnum]|uniref:Uncharacterized protein n=1 Tax=Desulfonema magnum TaxID=45655 RepID=A0A975BWK9_9BACT|nr:Uncharacterized protein dnm_087800 [Desulfonema magnum]
MIEFIDNSQGDDFLRRFSKKPIGIFPKIKAVPANSMFRTAKSWLLSVIRQPDKISENFWQDTY